MSEKRPVPQKAIVPPIEGLPGYVAHTPPDAKSNEWHMLVDHILDVTEMAARFATTFDRYGVSIQLARYLGLVHDLGKFTLKFQEYLWKCHLAALLKTSPPPPGSAPHKQMGVLAIGSDLEDDTPFASVLYGHHGGMPAPREAFRKSREKTNAAEVIALRKLASSIDPRLAAVFPDISALDDTPHVVSEHAQEMYLRFLFSCLVDADALDTEEHHRPDKAEIRERPIPTIEELRDTLRRRQRKDFDSDGPPTVVNEVRKEVYDTCCRAALLYRPGVFSLTVPTGGGKTRSSLAFGLEHAAERGLRRVIYGIPFTSIIDQTAATFRDLFEGFPNAVLEHHSAIDMQAYRKRQEGTDEEANAEEHWRRLATQNWDSIITVTTTVQLFESLFSNRPSACRKLHRLANSVIILDEVQTLPSHLLAPLLDGLKSLVAQFGATVVLCTATQPALTSDISPFLQGFDEIIPIIPDADRDRHFERLRRVTYRVDLTPTEWPDIAVEMQGILASGRSALCVVNTRKQALDLFHVLSSGGDDVFHLSTLMCGQHRRDVLELVRRRLKKGPPLLLASTQTIEAGVDIDFPRVFRALGPLERIIQAAGRCNREGSRSREESEVVIFKPAQDTTPGGHYTQAVSVTENLFRLAIAKGEAIDLDDPALVTDYFREFYNGLQSEVDRKGVQQCRQDFDYPEVARRVRLIEEDTVGVLLTACPWLDAGSDERNEAEERIKSIVTRAAQWGGMTRQLWQEAQPFSVSIYRTDAERLLVTGEVKEADGVEGLLLWKGEYHPKTGIAVPRGTDDVPIYRADTNIL